MLATGLDLLTNVLKDVDNEERRDKIIDALNVAAGRMPDGPDEQNPLKDLKKKEKQMTYDYTGIHVL